MQGRNFRRDHHKDAFALVHRLHRVLLEVPREVEEDGLVGAPREVENVLHALEGIYEAAVIGVPDDLLGQAVKAFVTLKPGFAYTEREVIKHCAGRLENFMAPKYVEFVDSLPKTDTGKIKKTGLA